MTKLPKLGLCSARVCWPLINRVMNRDGQDEQDFFSLFSYPVHPAHPCLTAALSANCATIYHDVCDKPNDR